MRERYTELRGDNKLTSLAEELVQLAKRTTQPPLPCPSQPPSEEIQTERSISLHYLVGVC